MSVWHFKKTIAANDSKNYAITESKMIRTTLVICATLIAAGCSVTPEPFSDAALAEQRAARLEQVAANQAALDGPVSLYEAMARALKYNLDFKVEMMEEALASRELDVARWDMLPSIVANAGYSNRSNYSGSRSSALLGANSVGGQSLVPSTSSEKDIISADLTASWDVLDFGLSYVRAKQQGDSVLIAQERRRKVANRIVEDVRTAYWRAVSSERLLSRLSELEADIEGALVSSRKVFERRKTPPLAALTYQRELLQIKQQIQTLNNELVVAKRQLAALMNINPAQSYQLVMPDRGKSLVDIQANPDMLVKTALLYRPELREASYRQRINEQEASAALLELLPSLRFYGGFNHNSNDYLYSNNWTSWGAQTSWNVFEVFRYPAKKRGVKAEQKLLDQRALALTMAVMTQVHVSTTRFELARRKLDNMRDYHDVQGKILEQTHAGYKARKVSQQNFIRETMNDILSEAKYDIALAELQNAFANIYASVGLDPYGQNISLDLSVEELASKLQSHWIERGDATQYLP